MRIKNLPSIESMDGSQDALVIEQTDGSEDKSRKVSPAQIKQYVQTGDFEATGEIKDGHGNILADMAKANEVKGIAEAGDFESTGEVKDGHGNILKDMAKSADVSTISAKHTITTTTSGVTINRGEYFTLGKLVFVSLDVTTTVSATFATLPKPVSQVNVLNCDYPKNANGTFFQLNPNGTLEVYRNSATSARCIANLIYLSNDV